MYGFACVCMCRSGGRRPCRLFFDVHGGSASVLQSCVCCRPGLGRHIRCQLFCIIRLYTFGKTPYGSCAPARIAVDRSTSHARPPGTRPHKTPSPHTTHTTQQQHPARTRSSVRAPERDNFRDKTVINVIKFRDKPVINFRYYAPGRVLYIEKEIRCRRNPKKDKSH